MGPECDPIRPKVCPLSFVIGDINDTKSAPKREQTQLVRYTFLFILNRDSKYKIWRKSTQ